MTEVEMETLDGYVERSGIRRVDIVKLDVEGSELLVLRGARKLLQLKPPPAFVIEMNLQTSAAFGFHPSELLGFLDREASYEFLRVCGARGEVRPMTGTSDFSHGDNVVALPRDAKGLRAAVLSNSSWRCTMRRGDSGTTEQ